MNVRRLLSVLFLGLLTAALPLAAAGAKGQGGRGGGGTGSPGRVSGPSHATGRSAASHGGYYGRYHGGGHYGGRYGGYWGYWGPGYGWGWGGGWWGPWPYWGGVAVYSSSQVRPAPGRFAVVDIEVEPDSAEVFLDGTYVGKADDFDGMPGYLYVLPGKYQIELRHPLYVSVTVDLDVHRGEKVQVDRKLKLAPGKSKLDSFDPPDRGTPLGRFFGPRATPVDPRRSQDRQRPAWRSGDGGDGQDTQVDRSEESKPPARLPEARTPRKTFRPRIDWTVSPDDASVYLDDRFVGTAEDLNAGGGTRIEPGPHTVTVVRPGFKTKTLDIEVKPAAPLKVAVELEK